MAPLFDVYHLRRIYHRTDIVVLLCRLRKRQQTVEAGNDIRIDLYLRNKLLHTQNQVVEEFSLQGEYLILSPQDLLFVLLQLLGDIALCLGQCLLAHPLLRHQVFIGVAHFKVIAEDIVVADFQGRDTRLLSLALLDF